MTQPALQRLAASLTPDQLSAVMATSTTGTTTHTNMRLSAKALKSSSKKGASTGTVKATRPLNSWMAFRSYYSAVFSGLQQKDISGFLTYLWQADPFQAKWSVLAKSYSIIRDSIGKENIPLDAFLALNAPQIGIIPPKLYLDALGWEIIVGSANETVLRRASDFEVTSLDSEVVTINMSVIDVLHHSIDCGLVAGDAIDPSCGAQDTLMGMSSMSLPHDLVNSSATANRVRENNAMTDFSHEASAHGNLSTQGIVATDTNSFVTHPDHADAFASPDISQQIPLSVDTNTDYAYANDMGLSPASLKWIDDEMAKLYTPAQLAKLAEDTAKIVQAYNPNSALSNDKFFLDGEFPFNSEFDPDNSGIAFDPFAGDAFNAFNMSDFVYEDAF